MVSSKLKFSAATELRCSNCNKAYRLSSINTYAGCCERPLLVRYEPGINFQKENISHREKSMWRYFEMLPVFNGSNIVSLGEGMTPVIELNNLSAKNNFASLLLKDESLNPTGSFKARGLSMAVTKAKELGIDKCIMPSAGNAGVALAAYCAKANMKCIVVMPEHTPEIFKNECRLYGAELVLVKGLISDCAVKVEEIKKERHYFDLSTLKEPYRLEGKKTMGYEIVEQLNGELPDAIIYPAGGGTGLIGIWKAFQELVELGWIKGPLPKMIAVQAFNCAPLLAAQDSPANWKKNFTPQPSIAYGLAVPYPFGIELMQKVIEESGGDIVTVTEQEMLEGIKEVAKEEGILLSPEGSATWKAIPHLLKKNIISRENRVLMLNTGSGLKFESLI
jgi:threonine synthase